MSRESGVGSPARDLRVIDETPMRGAIGIPPSGADP
jgi:hypothetical protein